MHFLIARAHIDSFILQFNIADNQNVRVLCNLRFTATQYALLSALASIAGRLLTGTTAGGLIDTMGYVNFYLLTTLVALPGVVLFWYMIRSGLADLSIGSAGTAGGT